MTGKCTRVFTLSFLGVVVAAALVAAVVWFATFDRRQLITLHELAGSFPYENLKDRTPELCAESAGCLEGFSDAQWNLLKFDSLENATRFANGVRDAYQSNWIVIEYTGDVDDKVRLNLQGGLDTMGTFVP